MVMVQLDKETIFTFNGSTSFFYCSYVFSPVFPLLFLFFFHGWIAMKFAEMPTSEECGVRQPPPPLATSLAVQNIYRVSHLPRNPEEMHFLNIFWLSRVFFQTHTALLLEQPCIFLSFFFLATTSTAIPELFSKTRERGKHKFCHFKAQSTNYAQIIGTKIESHIYFGGAVKMQLECLAICLLGHLYGCPRLSYLLFIWDY